MLLLASGEYVMSVNNVCDYFHINKVTKQKSVACIYQVPDSVRFDQVKITDVPGPVPVHLWLDHTITNIRSISNSNHMMQMKTEWQQR